MKFSIVTTDKNNVQHLTVKPAEAFLDRIQTDTKGHTIGKLREFVASNGTMEGYEPGQHIARIFPSVEMARRDNGRLEVVAFNGLVTLHVPGLLRREDQQAVKEAAKVLPMTYAAFVGADGRSVEILVSVARDDGLVPTDEQGMDALCKVAYDAAYRTYGGALSKPIERQIVTALTCFPMTLDEQPWVNPDVSPMKVGNLPLPTKLDDDDIPRQLEPDPQLYADYELLYKQAAEAAYDETADIIESQHFHAYITELSRQLCLLGVPEEEAFLHLRNHHHYKKDYDEDTFRAIVSAVYDEQKPKRLGDVTNMTSYRTRQLIKLLKTRFVFRKDTVKGYTEYRPNNTGDQEWAPCTVEVTNSMTIMARQANLDVTFNEVRRHTQTDTIQKYDPLMDYFMKVDKAWDGTSDPIGQLARAVPCNIPQWETWFRKWFLAMVAQWLGCLRNYGNAIMPLLISPQGDGKSTFCRNLLPKELRWGYKDNLILNEKKQTLQAMRQYLLINLDEFNQISPNIQKGFLKNTVQLATVKIKPPYGRREEDFRRMASFIATTNEQQVLADLSGSRRFICVRLTAPINFAAMPSYDALYSQAYHLVKNNEEPYWFSADEVNAIIEHNREFTQEPLALAYFNEYFEPASNESEGQWLSPTAIYAELRSIPGSGLSKNEENKFGAYLTHYPGLKKKRLNTHNAYLVRRKK